MLSSIKKIQFSDQFTTNFIYILSGLLIVGIIIYWIYHANLESRSCSAMNSLYGELNGSIHSIQSFNYDLRDYYIKSAYNCCSPNTYRNDYVDICALKNVLKQGCRGLDFEIYSINNQPVVATSTQTSNYIKETFNSVSMSDVMSTIQNYAFNGSQVPNPSDPLILHFRIKSTNQDMYTNFAKLLEGYNSILLGKEYSYENHGKNLGEIPLSNFMGKTIIIVDRLNNSFLENKEFYEFVNMSSNSIYMRALPYHDIQYSPDITELTQFNQLGMSIGMPNNGANPTNPNAIVLRECGIQMIAMRFSSSSSDSFLQESNTFFDTNGQAFVLKPENLRYQKVTIEEPPKQNPNLSYETRTITNKYYQFDI